MKTYYYIETYFRGDPTPYLIGDSNALFIAESIEAAEAKIATMPTNAAYKPVEAFEHLADNRERYPHFPSDMNRDALYRQIDVELTQGISKLI